MRTPSVGEAIACLHEGSLSTYPTEMVMTSRLPTTMKGELLTETFCQVQTKTLTA